MRFCDAHWAKLRAAIKDRGLEHLVAKTAEQVIESMKADLQREERPYDPLMDCHWMIVNKALQVGGLYLMGKKEDGSDYCPVCEGISHEAGDEAFWIIGPADAVLEHCREKGLVPGVQ